MLRFASLDPALINPTSDPLVFEATLNAHGTYTTEHFVLRLSPRVHELVEALTNHKTDDYEPEELIQAYSTYLHETVHWWQHMGSTAGLILSLAYPAQIYGSMVFLQAFAREVGGVKPVKAWADRELIEGKTHEDPGLAAANIAVNNALDISYYKQLAMSPRSALEHERSPFFLGVGHSYLKAYGDTVSAINGSCDFESGQFPDPESWDGEMRRLHENRCEGFPYGPRPPLAEIGLRHIFEGQARFCQIQYLAAAGGPESLETYRTDGYFAPLYVDAFELFLRLTMAEWPERYDDPLVGLFLLICDLAINPTRGFPLDIESFDDLICDMDAGARFTRLCLAAAEMPELQKAVQTFSALEYRYVTARLTERCGYDDPRVALRAIVGHVGDQGPIDALMEEHRTFAFSGVNMPVRVLVAHHIAFSRDKLERPEFFCWPGIYMAGEKATDDTRALFIEHLSLFQDRADTRQIFPRAMPGRSHENIRALVNGFFSGMLVYDLAVQWTLRPGPFRYDFGWLTGKAENEALIDVAKRQFQHYYGLSPDDCRLVEAPELSPSG
ncbi:hypothetical protein DMC47_32325 [Nostoc sp. 3335mG]|nr:hypothetical protein DMC47_32325 [Nostoc sp. 3335mG]